MPAADPRVLNRKTNKVRETLFFHHPPRLTVSDFSVEKSPTRGFLIHASVAAVTMPAPTVGLRDVKGAAINAVMMVSGCALASKAPSADNPPLMTTHS